MTRACASGSAPPRTSTRPRTPMTASSSATRSCCGSERRSELPVAVADLGPDPLRHVLEHVTPELEHAMSGVAGPLRVAPGDQAGRAGPGQGEVEDDAAVAWARGGEAVEARHLQMAAAADQVRLEAEAAVDVEDLGGCVTGVARVVG